MLVELNQMDDKRISEMILRICSFLNNCRNLEKHS